MREAGSWLLNTENHSIRDYFSPKPTGAGAFTGAARGNNSTEKRLARLLLLLVTQETTTEMIGTTRSRVSYFMNKFRELGFIDHNGRLEVTVRC